MFDLHKETVLEQGYRKNHKVRTIEDLWNIPVEPSRFFVKPVVDTYLSKDMDWEEYFTGVYEKYLRNLRPDRPWWQKGWNRQLTRWQDKLRWKLHLKLLDWGIII